MSAMTAAEEAEHERLVRRRRQRGGAFYAASTPLPEGAAFESSPSNDRVVAEAVRLSTARSRGGAENASDGISTPASEELDDKILAHSARLDAAYADTIGRRPTMEDMIVLHGRFRGRDDNDYVAVFDGHGGASTSHFCARRIHQELADLLAEHEDDDINEVAPRCLREAFLRTQAAIEHEKVDGGSTGIVAFVTHDVLFIANAGDSRAVVGTVAASSGRTESVKRLSTDHKPDLPSEEERIRAVGGHVTKINAFNGRVIARVNGVLAVSRALGDVFLVPSVTAEPEVKQHPLREASGDASDLLIVACDGLWDVLSDEEAFGLIDADGCHNDVHRCALLLRDAAVERQSGDNISVVVLRLPARSAPGPASPSSPKKTASSQRQSQPGMFSGLGRLLLGAAITLAGIVWLARSNAVKSNPA